MKNASIPPFAYNDTEITYKIQQKYPSMSEGERKVADYLLGADFSSVLPNINELADSAQTSVSTIVRFCKTLGFTGYSEFKYHYQNETPAPLGGNIQLSSADSISEIKEKVGNFTQQAIWQTISTINNTQLEKAITAISYARQIVVCGEGSASGIAALAANAFMCLGFPCCYIPDTLTQLRYVSFHGKNDVIIGITNDGYIKDVVDALMLAQSKHATTICITGRSGSLVTKYSDIVLYTTLKDDQSPLDLPITSICQLIILHLVQIGLIARNPKLSGQHVRHLQSLSDRKRYDYSVERAVEGRIHSLPDN